MFNRYFFGRFYSSNLMVNINPVGQSVQSEIGSVAPTDGYHDGANPTPVADVVAPQTGQGL